LQKDEYTEAKPSPAHTNPQWEMEPEQTDPTWHTVVENDNCGCVRWLRASRRVHGVPAVVPVRSPAALPL
jgi:hypothetical protein